MLVVGKAGPEGRTRHSATFCGECFEDAEQGGGGAGADADAHDVVRLPEATNMCGVDRNKDLVGDAADEQTHQREAAASKLKRHFQGTVELLFLPTAEPGGMQGRATRAAEALFGGDDVGYQMLAMRSGATPADFLLMLLLDRRGAWGNKFTDPEHQLLVTK